MNPEEIHQKLQAKFADEIIAVNTDALDPYIQVAPARFLEIATFLCEDPALSFKSLMSLSGMDYGAETELGVVYSLHSLAKKHKITIRINVDRTDAHIPSAETVWRTADWHEREAYDLFGIHFDGHRDLRRILCPEDWEGWPLRKDYIVQEYYHGMRVPYQEDWQKYETFSRNPERGHHVFEFESKVPGLLNGSQENGDDSAGKSEDRTDG